MNHKVDESVLIAYLYDELNTEEKEQVERFLEEHPESRESLEDLKKVRGVMGKLEDLEPPVPVIFSTPSHAPWTKFMPWLGMAAAVSLILLVGFLTNTSIRYQDQQLTIRFGKAQGTPPANSITEEQWLPMFQKALIEQNDQYTDQLQVVQSNLEQRLTASLASGKTNQPVQVDFDEKMLHAYLAEYQEQQMQQMAGLLQNNIELQREELQTFLAEYHQFLEERRFQDLQLIEAGFQAMQDNVNQQKSKTEEILANIITTVNSTNH